MKIRYAHLRTEDQTVALQVDALRKAGCTKVYPEIMSGGRNDRPTLVKLPGEPACPRRFQILTHFQAGVCNEPTFR